MLGVASLAFAVYGGAPVPAGEGEAVAYLEWRAGSRGGACTGVLVSPRAVLTAAHCVRSPSGAALRVRSVRIGNPAGRTERARVVEVRAHPDFDPAHPDRGADLAVLRLSRAVEGRAPPALATPAQHPEGGGARVVIRGFGLTRAGSRPRVARGLSAVRLEALTPHHCFSGPVQEMARTRWCAAAPSAGVCPGDSGSPATVTEPGGPEVLVGVTSLALDAGCTHGAAILTKVATYREWIAAAAGR